MSDEKVDAWMPLWIGSYLADTTHLSRDSHGGYLLLLIAYWRNKGPLVDDGDRLRNIVKATPAEWKRLRPILAEFFDLDGNLWVHGRADKELAAAGMRKAAATSKAKAGAEARWGKGPKQSPSSAPSDAPSIAQAVPEDCPTPSPYSVSNETDGAALPSAVDNSEDGNPEPPPAPDPLPEPDKGALWRDAVALLKAEGVAETTCRTFMGELVGTHRLPIVRKAIDEALALSPAPADARAWLVAACKRIAAPPPSIGTVEAGKTKAMLDDYSAVESKPEVRRAALDAMRVGVRAAA